VTGDMSLNIFIFFLFNFWKRIFTCQSNGIKTNVYI